MKSANRIVRHGQRYHIVPLKASERPPTQTNMNNFNIC
jgi:hypothetical protein